MIKLIIDLDVQEIYYNKVIYKMTEMTELSDFKNIINRSVNTHGYDQKLALSKLNLLELKNLFNTYLGRNSHESDICIEENFADIGFNGISINKMYRDTFKINRFDNVYYTSNDPTFKIDTSNDIVQISYTHDGTTYQSQKMCTYDPVLISNYNFFHDFIFGFVLDKYVV